MPKIPLWDSAPGYNPDFGQEAPSIEPFLVEDGQEHGAVIVFPGGGYTNLAPHEGEPIARMLNAAGVSAFVLRYRVFPYQHPIPWLDASRAVRLVRARAAEWKVRPNKIGVLGFSAGGHLAATISTHNDLGRGSSSDPVEQVSSRPDASILCYPVITSDSRYYHGGSLRSLLGDFPDPQLVMQFSAENAVNAQTPPTFLWHTANDQSVPLENSLLYAAALHRCGVPVELHVFPNGRHGLGLAPEDPAVAAWTGLCARWLQGLEF